MIWRITLDLPQVQVQVRFLVEHFDLRHGPGGARSEQPNGHCGWPLESAAQTARSWNLVLHLGIHYGAHNANAWVYLDLGDRMLKVGDDDRTR